jgi:hypothetical protein
LTNRSFVARPTEGGGFTGVYVHQDASPEEGQLALLLAAPSRRGRPPAPGPGTAPPSTGAGRPGPAPRTR